MKIEPRAVLWARGRTVATIYGGVYEVAVSAGGQVTDPSASDTSDASRRPPADDPSDDSRRPPAEVRSAGGDEASSG